MMMTSCQKDTTTNQDGILPDPQLAKGVTSPLATEERCNCEYRIYNASFTTPPSGYNFNFGVFAEENCVGSINCSYFAYAEECDLWGDDPCADYEAVGNTKPTAWEPFNCGVVFYNDFGVRLDYALFRTDSPSCFSTTEKPDGFVQIQVRCKGGDGLLSCNTTAWNYSDIITHTFEDGEPIYTQAPIVSLEDCGCTPEVSYFD